MNTTAPTTIAQPATSPGLPESSCRNQRRLTPEMVRRVHELKAAGVSSRQIARHLGIDRRHVWRILRGDSWRGLHPTKGGG
jgi:DNA invertase Pin-like site-specific DNA recombinase